MYRLAQHGYFYMSRILYYWAIVGAVPKIRRAVEGLRTHPYARVTLS